MSSISDPKTQQRLLSRREAHRTIKIWRALWKVAAASGYCRRDADPSLGVRNRAAKGRQQFWSEGEAVRLIKEAWRLGFHGLAAALAVMWDSQLSPGDVRGLVAGQIKLMDGRVGLLVERSKTGRRAGAALSPRTARLLSFYFGEISVALHDDAPVFRTRGHHVGDGRPWAPRPYTKDELAEDFREVRKAVFGSSETRQVLDFRRSGAVEAIQVDAEPARLAHALGNTLAASNALSEA